jgi:hypothetical protein
MGYPGGHRSNTGGICVLIHSNSFKICCNDSTRVVSEFAVSGGVTILSPLIRRKNDVSWLQGALRSAW